jgi:phosphoribosyl-ATP pyrophosphohydrolase/phosphoribosyl-AMP cyclohydrolase
VVELLSDCDGDAVLARVIPSGPACHTGDRSCFGAGGEVADILAELDTMIGRRVRATRGGAPGGAAVAARAPSAGAAAVGPPPDREGSAPPSPSRHRSDAPPINQARPSYTQRLLDDRNLRLKKIGEEAAELIGACADANGVRAAEEMADLVYHALVALRAAGGSLEDVRRILASRRR